MKLVLFDLGNTLESAGMLQPGALETLEAIAALRDGEQPAAELGLLSDFDMPDEPSDVPIIQQRYYQLLEDLGIRQFFEPVAEHVTLSTEVGVFKPDEAVFRVAASKGDPALEFGDVLFVTENRSHVLAARRLGLQAVHIRAPGQLHGEVDTLPELVPLVQQFLNGGGPVETFVVDAPPETRDALMNRIAATAATWTRLGDVVVVRSQAHRGAKLDLRAELTGAHRLNVPEQHLHVVTQISRLFQEDHPDVPVLVDKGRYLVVAFDPAAPGRADGPHASDYDVRPLPSNTVVFDQRAAGPGRTTTAVEQARGPAGALSRTSFTDDVGTLGRMRTRHSRSADFLDALEWAAAQLVDLGYATTIQTVTLPGGTTRNLIADRPGDGEDRQVVLVTAHLDSVNIQGTAAVAPGADDNASGSAGVLAIGRALAGQSITQDLRLILFGGEEQGLFGSLHYVGGLEAAERSRIRAVINMDMIACKNSSDATVLLEGATVSQSMIDELAGIALAHTSLAVQTSLNPFNSDHVPFIDLGIPAVLTIEGTDSANDRVHTDRDTLDTLDMDLAMEILRMNVTFVTRALA
ncbi:MAG: Peptidase [Pseudarthrobacter sp.]|nr:Peptidase [Pseudarthrobacter sp.]